MKARLGDRAGHLFRHRVYVSDRQIRIERVHALANRTEQRTRRARCPDHQRLAIEGGLPHGEINCRSWRGCQARVFHVSDDSDHCRIGQENPSERSKTTADGRQLLSDRAALQPILPGQGLIDNHYRLRGGRVLIGEEAARQQRSSQRLEQIRTHHPMERGLIVGILGCGNTKEVKWQTVIEILLQRQASGYAGRFYSRKRRDRIEQAVEEH